MTVWRGWLVHWYLLAASGSVPGERHNQFIPLPEKKAACSLTSSANPLRLLADAVLVEEFRVPALQGSAR